MPMNPEVKAKWVAKLRLPEMQDRQTDGCLKRNTDDGDKFCCLGVLTEIAVEDGIIGAAGMKYSETMYAYAEPAESNGFVRYEESVLPTMVKAWAGIKDANPDVSGIVHIEDKDGEWHPMRVTEPISTFNDEHKFTFAQLADLIEEQF